MRTVVRGQTIEVSVEMVIEECCNCGVMFAMTKDFKNEKRYKQESARADHEQHRANGYKGHATRISKRVKHGVCICCNRTFQDLAAHMATKHPTFTPQDSVEEPLMLREKAGVE